MTKSEKCALVLRSTSFTIRARFTPANACSTLTRMRASARLCRFSLRDNFPLRGFFSAGGFGLRAVHRPESRYPYTNGMTGITERFEIGNLLVVDLPGVGLTQVAHPLRLGMDYHHILVTVSLVFATVGQGLFCWALRALAAAVRPL